MKYVIAVLALALSVVSYQLYLAQVKVSKAETTVSQMETRHAKALAKAEGEARKAEQELVAKTAAIRKETNEKINTLNAQRDVLLSRVLHAEANAATALLLPRPSETAGDGETATGDNQPELLGKLGEADVHEAMRADIVREHLLACYRQYDSVRKLRN